MTYSDVAIFGVYISPFAPMLVIAAIVTMLLLRLADGVGWTCRVWHPALFNTALYVIVLYGVAFAFGAVGVSRL